MFVVYLMDRGENWPIGLCCMLTIEQRKHVVAGETTPLRLGNEESSS